MTTITVDLLKTLRAECEAALLVVAKKHGVVIGMMGTARYNSTSATFKLDVAVPNGDAPEGACATTIKAATDFKKMAGIFGLDAGMLGKTFEFEGSLVTIIGLLPSRRKYPVVCSPVSGKGKKYLLEVATVLRGLGKPVPA